MEDRVVCCVCGHAIYSNRPAVQCKKCFGWCTKVCSGLNSAEFNKCNSLAEERLQHN